MHRLIDYYNWNTLKEWLYVVEKGSVKRLSVENGELEQNILDRIIFLLKNDCFPISIICICKEDQSKTIIETTIWKGIFEYIDNKRFCIDYGKKLYFKDLSKEDQNNILNAQISSVWVGNG